MQPKASISSMIYSLAIVSASLLLFWQFVPRSVTAGQEPGGDDTANYDIRTDQNSAAKNVIAAFMSRVGKSRETIDLDEKPVWQAAERLRADTAGSVTIEFNETLGSAEIISPGAAVPGEWITSPNRIDEAEILRVFLSRHAELFGMDHDQILALGTSLGPNVPNGKISFVQLDQKINGIPVFQGEVKAGLTPRGEIIRIINNLAPNLDYESLSDDFGDPKIAVFNAAEFVGASATDSDVRIVDLSGEKITFQRGQFAAPTTAEKYYFPVARGVARPAWRVLLWTENAAFYVIVDAQDGTLLWRKNITETQTETATYNVYGNLTSFLKTHDSPAPFTPGCIDPNNCPQPPSVNRQSFTLTGNEPPYTFNTNGWIPDGENRTIGNAAEAGIDRDGIGGIDPDGWAFGAPYRNFVYTYNPAPGNPPPGEGPLPTTQTYPPSAFQQGSITNAFYAINRWHDEMYLLGFNEAARNFQTDNFGRGGLGNDSIAVEVQDSSGTNGGSFSTPADGGRPRLQLFIWTGSTPHRDGALDAQVAIHEVTHGLSNRLHGNTTGLSTNMARGMGEGWSDFYSLALLSDPADDLNGVYSTGCYSTAGLANCYYGIRRFPTARITVVGPNGLPHNPLTFGNLNAGNCTTFPSAFPRGPIGSIGCDQVHNAGEIWSAALWEMRAFLIDAHGSAEGNRRTLQYITDGMKLAPLNPTFLQARDAILAAAVASVPADVRHVWRGFATRGMGFSARINSISPANVVEAFDRPNVVIGSGFAVSDAPGNGNGYPEAGETLRLTIPLVNNSGAAITGVTLQVAGGASAFYGDIQNGQTVSQNINFTVPVNVPCPGDFVLTFNINSSEGFRSETRTIFLGIPIVPPVTFTNTTPITIPDSGPAAPYPSVITVSGLSGPKTIKVELTGFSHTWADDVDVLLESPSGQKMIIMSDVFGDTDATATTIGISDHGPAGLMPDNGPLAPGDYKPTNVGANDAFAAPAPAGPYANPAPAGSATLLSTFGASGEAMNGDWKLWIVDDAGTDAGTVQGWNLTFESEYVCGGFFPRARFDFDGDGRTDISVFRPSEGNWYLNNSTAGFSVINWGISTDRPAPGDFDGDGKTDTAVFRATTDPAQPDFYVLNSIGFTFSGYSWGLPDDLPVVADYDGDGKDDIAVFRPSNHTYYVLNSAAGTVLTFSNIQFGTPVVGDFDGDRKADFATYSIDGWFLAPSNTNYGSVTFTRWGAAGDKPVPADYDGDGKDDFAVFRPSDGTWYIRRSSGGNTIVQFGLSNDIPVPGDYDGDGRADIAVYRGGIWYLNQSTAGVSIANFGLSDDRPIPR